MRKSSTHGFCTILCKALMTFCCLLALHVYHAAAQAPTFTSSPVTTATVGQPYQYSVQATDPNNLPMTFSAGSMPSWLSFSTAGQSTSSQFGGTVNAPGGVAGDAAGNIYVTENYGTKIYKITLDGTMTHWATRPVGSVYAMLVVGDDLLVSYYSINSTNRITKINLTGTPTETPWISSPALNNPLSMVERNGFLFVADYGAGRLRKVNLNTGAVSDVLTLSGIFGLGFNSAGTLYLASYGLRKIYTADVTSGNPQNTLTEVLSFTPNITDVKIDANDNVYISANGFVRKYNPSLTSFVPCWSGSGWVWGMSLTTGGTLVFGLNSANMVHRLQTGAVLTGTPALADIGVHNVSLDVTNGTQTTNQGFSISVSGPSTFQTSPITVPYGTAAITLSDPASNSSGAFTYTSNNNAVASVNGNILTIAGMGTATITATQAASGLYLQTPRTFTVTVTAPAPSFGSWPAISKLRNDAPFTLTAPASNSSGNITYSSSNQQVATISGTTVTITGIGTTTITASQVAAGNYAQGSTTTTLTVSSGVPVIGSLTLASKTYGDQPFTLTDPAV
jgi:sugar lactone lactonase YvrE